MTKEFQAALEAANHHIPFALFAYPGTDDFHFMANPSGKSADTASSFIINRWNTPFSDSIRIYDEMNVDQFLGCLPEIKSESVESETGGLSTTHDEYIDKITKLIEVLNKRGGKTVFSRVISECGISLDIGKLMIAQFKSFPDTFRFFYYTPETGLWLGTSPELLLDYKVSTQEFRTMSLAGTRITDSKAWDNKNIHEQNLVAEFISGVLMSNGAQFVVKRCKDVHFEPVCHICDMFTGTLPSGDTSKLLDELSPTPAVSGFPVDIALNEIASLESHSRECYGGYVGYSTPDNLKCYVNLRSVKLSETGYCIFAGGGVTAASQPEEEWRETENKTLILRRNIIDAKRKK